jgi:predicted MFS family arabinose efflux permease
MLCREWFGAEAGSIVFGWVFAAHQLGASAMAFGAGVIRDRTGSYDPAFYAAAGLCVVAALLSVSIRRSAEPARSGIPVPVGEPGDEVPVMS